MKLRFFWDFYGPNAEKTARHFDQHLQEFFGKNALSLPSGVLESGEHHWSAYCDPPDVPQAMQTPATIGPNDVSQTVADKVGHALRPQRVETVPSADSLENSLSSID